MFSRFFPKLAALTLLLSSACASLFSAPVITTQPADKTILTGASVDLSVSATGIAPLTYRWDVSTNGGSTWAPVSADALHGAPNQATLQLNAVPLTWQNCRYRVAVSDASSTTIVSNPITLTVEYSELWGMGNNANGQLGDGTIGYRLTPTSVNTDIAAVAAGTNHTLFLKQDGTLWASGFNLVGQLGDGTRETRSVPVKIAEQVIKIAASGDQSFFIKSDGTLWACGANDQGQLGAGEAPFIQIPIQISTNVTAVSANIFHVLFVKNDGTLWGSGSSNGLGDHRGTTPHHIDSSVAKIAAGYGTTLYIKTDSSLWAIGEGGNGQFGDGYSHILRSPQQISSDMAQVATGRDHSLFLKNDGSVWSAGANAFGQLGTSNTTQQYILTPVTNNAKAIAVNSQTSFIVKNDNTLVAFGLNHYGQLGDGTQENRLTPITIAADVINVAAGPGHIIWVKSDGTAWSAGYNVFGQLGDGYIGYKTRPVLVTTNVEGYVAGQHYSLYITSDNRLWGMGSNANGKLGDGTIITRPTPIPIATHVASVSAGSTHTLYLKKDGSLWGMGGNNLGQLGDGTQLERHLPIQVATGVSAAFSNIRSASTHFIKGPGELWGSGNNYYGQLGDHTSQDFVLIPQLIRSDVQTLFPGVSHLLYTLIADDSQTLWGRGQNSAGQLGNGSTYYSTPRAIAPHIIFASSSELSTYYITSEGILFGMGSNSSGQLGNGMTSGLYTPPVEIMSGVTHASMGSNHGLIVKADKTLWSTGQNTFGILGDGTVADRVTPVQIATDVVSASAGTIHSLFLKRGVPKAPIIITQPQDISIEANNDATLQVIVRGLPTPHYQWRKNGVAISGANESSLSFPAAQDTESGNYDVVITNSLGTVTSQVAMLTVIPVLEIKSLSPVRQVLSLGETLNLNVNATGAGPLGYQWYHNGRALAGATQANFSTPNSSLQTSGYYWVKITDDNRTQQSRTLFVNVTPERTQLRAWGNNENGPLDLPSSFNDILSFAMGERHMLAIRRNGTLVGWGEDSFGKLELVNSVSDAVSTAVNYGASYVLKSDGTVVSMGYPGLSNFPSGLSDVVAIDVELSSGLALRSNGTVVSWGDDYGVNQIPAGLDNVSAIALGKTLALALKQDGTVVTWGAGISGIPVPATATDVVAIAAGTNHALALKGDGTVIAWGTNLSGATDVPAGLNNVVAIEAYHERSAAIKADGTVVYWGYKSEIEPPPPPEATSVIQVGLGVAYVTVLRDASADASATIITQPASQTLGEGAKATLSVTVNGVGPFTYQWRKNGVNIENETSDLLVIRPLSFVDAGTYDVAITHHLGTIVSAPATIAVKPVPVITSLSPTRHVVVPGAALNLNVTATGIGALHYQWTRNGQPIAGATSASLSIPSVSLQDSGYYLAFITDDNGTQRSAPMFVTVAPALSEIISWGNGFSGQREVPLGFNQAIAVSGGDYHTLLLDRSGKVTVLVQANSAPADLTNVVSIATSPLHSMALKADGTVVAWSGYSNRPENIVPPGLTDVVAIAAGENVSAALKADGTVVVWGDNQFGLLAVPKHLDAVTSIAAGLRNIVALRADGTVVQWGQRSSTAPDLVGARAVGSGRFFSIALRADGSIVGWSQYSDNLPPPTLGTNFTAIAAMTQHALALHSDGTVVAWGSGFDGEINVPEGLDRVFAIGVGGWTSFALRDATNDIPPSITDQPDGGNFAPGQNMTLSVTALGDSLHYQWRRNGINISGATSPALSFTPLSPTDAGQYDVVVSSHLGSVTSHPAVIWLTTPSAFVQTLYQRLLQRAPTAAELLQSENKLTAGTSRSSLVLDLLESPQYQERQWERVIRLYYATFNRMPDYPGLLSWSEALRSGSQTPAQVGAAFAGSAEFRSTYGSLTNAQFVQQLYRNVLGREADQLGINTWGASLAAGMTRGTLLLAFADSTEFQNRMTHTVQVVSLYTLLDNRTPSQLEFFTWTDFLRGADFTELMLASSDFKTRFPSGLSQADYVRLIFPGFLRRASDPVTLLPWQIDTGQTTRARLVADLTDSSEFHSLVAPVVRFYLACLNRSPDTVGLNHWTHQLRSGTSLAGLADAFALSSEFNSRYGSMSNSQFVSQLYFDTLGRGPDADGLNHWTYQLNTSGESRASMLLTFANSAEAVERFAPNIRILLHHITFLDRTPSQTESAFWHNYLSSLEAQFIEEFLAAENI